MDSQMGRAQRVVACVVWLASCAGCAAMLPEQFPTQDDAARERAAARQRQAKARAAERDRQQQCERDYDQLVAAQAVEAERSRRVEAARDLREAVAACPDTGIPAGTYEVQRDGTHMRLEVTPAGCEAWKAFRRSTHDATRRLRDRHGTWEREYTQTRDCEESGIARVTAEGIVAGQTKQERQCVGWLLSEIGRGRSATLPRRRSPSGLRRPLAASVSGWNASQRTLRARMGCPAGCGRGRARTRTSDARTLRSQSPNQARSRTWTRSTSALGARQIGAHGWTPRARNRRQGTERVSSQSIREGTVAPCVPRVGRAVPGRTRTCGRTPGTAK